MANNESTPAKAILELYQRHAKGEPIDADFLRFHKELTAIQVRLEEERQKYEKIESLFRKAEHLMNLAQQVTDARNELPLIFTQRTNEMWCQVAGFDKVASLRAANAARRTVGAWQVQLSHDQNQGRNAGRRSFIIGSNFDAETAAEIMKLWVGEGILPSGVVWGASVDADDPARTAAPVTNPLDQIDRLAGIRSARFVTTTIQQ